MSLDIPRFTPENAQDFRKEGEFSVEEVLVAGNRGPCGGVNMSLQATRDVLRIVNGREPVFTNWDPVNNKPVVEELKAQGLVNVKNNWDLVPNGSITLFSAHGVPPEFFQIAEERDYHVIDTTCELVEKVQRRAVKAEQDGKYIVYVGTAGHPETIGVMGQVQPENVSLVVEVDDVDGLILPPDRRAIALSQTTLSVREVADKMVRLRERFPDIEIPPKKDICYAASNRQAAVEDMVKDVDFLLVVGSAHSHNSRMLKEIGDFNYIPSVLIDYPDEISDDWFGEEVKRVGLTSGASVEERFTEDVLDWFRVRGSNIRPLEQVVAERQLIFKLPQDQIDRLKARYSTS